jgi:chromosome segregation ATPase
MTEQRATVTTKLINPEIRERIIHAANLLVAEGIENPTNEQVRDAMVDKASFSHISPVMRAWRESKKAKVVAALDMPSEMKKAVESSLAQLWSTASKLATAAVESYRLEADEAIEEVATERDEALTEITQLEKRIVELEKVLVNKDLLIGQVNNDLEKERGRSTQLTIDNAALQVRIADKDSQIDNIKTDLNTSREESRQFQSDIVALNSAKQALSEEATAAKATLLAEQRHLATVEQQLSEQRTDHANRVEATEQRHQAEIARLTQLNGNHLAELRGQLESKAADLENQVAKSIAAGEKIQQQAETLGEYKTKAGVAEKALLEADKKIALLEQNQAGKSR